VPQWLSITATCETKEIYNEKRRRGRNSRHHNVENTKVNMFKNEVLPFLFPYLPLSFTSLSCFHSEI
jgi:hypothetical protein